MHTVEDRQIKRRSMEKNFRLAAHYSELNDMTLVKHHAELACQEFQSLIVEIEAASAVSGIEEE
jgi:hypothetical protein